MSASIKPQIFISWIPNGKINFTPQIYVSVVFVPHVEKATADTSRNLSKLENISADTFRKVGNAENTRADLKRNVKNVEKVFGDTSRKIGIETSFFDTCRVVKNISAATADTFRKVATLDKSFADTFRKIILPEKISADTFLQIKKNEKATADTLRGLREKAIADTFRKVVRPEKVVADTVIKIPHILNFIAQDSIINTFKDYDVSAFNVTLGERTLSDSFTFETAQEIHINDAVKGQFLDYPFSFLVEETDEQDLNFSVKGMYDIDKLLYSFIEMDLHDEREIYLNGYRYYGASSYVSKIAGYLGLTSNIKIEDFTPYNVVGNTDITYSDLISSLFSWTSRLPQRQINVFIRGNTLHCIQRGLEDSVFDISDIPHSRPKVNKKLLRSMYNSPLDDNDYDEEPTPFSGTISFGDNYTIITLTYQNGLLTKELNYFRNGDKTISKTATYEYIQHNNAYYTSHSYSVEKIQDDSSRETKIIDTIYSYKSYFGGTQEDFYLSSETEDSEKLEGAVFGALTTTEKTIRQTFHAPIGNGWYSATVYEDGEYQGSTISQGAPSNAVSQFTTNRMRQIFGTRAEDNSYEGQRSKLAAIADTSYPVRELDLLLQFKDDLEWLNRKIQVTVNVDLISKVENGVPDLKHIVDFTERVKLDGVEYFLVSNNFSLTPRNFIQKLQLVRWTE